MLLSRFTLPNEKKQPDSPSQSPGSSVKEFPAGNLATSSSRMAFLQTLCRAPKFRSMIDLIPAMVCAFLFCQIFLCLAVENF